MIDLGFIVPTMWLEQFATFSNYHLVLAHMIRDDPKYLEFYRRRSREGDFITLDNSSYELGDGVFTEQDLLDFAKEVEANEIMAPETYMDHESTILKVCDFYDNIKVRDSDMGVFATVHGSAYEKYMDCVNAYLKLGVDCIGLSCRLAKRPVVHNIMFCDRTPEWTAASVRMNLVVDIHSRLRDVDVDDRPVIHLLGLNQPSEIAFQMHYSDIIRSNDSSACFLAGRLGQSILPFTYMKPVEKMNFADESPLDDFQIKQITANLHDLKGMAGHYDIGDRYVYQARLK